MAKLALIARRGKFFGQTGISANEITGINQDSRIPVYFLFFFSSKKFSSLLRENIFIKSDYQCVQLSADILRAPYPANNRTISVP